MYARRMDTHDGRIPWLITIGDLVSPLNKFDVSYKWLATSSTSKYSVV